MRGTFVAGLVLTLLSSGGGAPGQTTLVKGVGVSPEGFPLDYSQLPAFFTEAGGIPSGGVLWNGAWRDDAASGANAGAIPAAARSVLQSSAIYGYTPAVVFGWRSGATLLLRVPGDARNHWANSEAGNLFAAMLGDAAAAYRPPFIFLGNEIDFYFESNPADYANWIAFYDRAYDVIKAASPETQVGPVFSYEHLAGGGRLTGWTTPYWARWRCRPHARGRRGHYPLSVARSRHGRGGAGRLSRPAVVENRLPARSHHRDRLARGKPRRTESSVGDQRGCAGEVALAPVGDDWRQARPHGELPLPPRHAESRRQSPGVETLRDPSGDPRAVYEAWLAFQRSIRRRSVRH